MEFIKSQILLFSSLVFALAVLNVCSASRLHRGPKNGGVRIITGHGLTSTNDSLVTQERPTLLRIQSEQRPHVVDFAFYIKRDLLIWDELKKDGVTISKCQIGPDHRILAIELQGQNIEMSDFGKGVVLAIERATLELRCKKHLPKFKNIDDSDSYIFLNIKKTAITHHSKISLITKVISGKFVVPIIDIFVHQEEASEPEVQKYKDVAFDDEEEDGSGPIFENSTSKLTDTSHILQSSNKFILKHKKMVVNGGADLSISANVDVKISGFRLTRLSGFQFQWDQSIHGTIDADLTLSKFMPSVRRTGKIVRWFIPRLSYTISVPVVGKLQAGAYVGIDWVTALAASANAKIHLSATYKRQEKVKAAISPRSYQAFKKKSGGASGFSSVDAGYSASFNLDGFFGVRPQIAVGISYSVKKVIFRAFVPKILKTLKSVNGNVGADIGTKLEFSFKKPAFLPYKGPDTVSDDCDKCHSAQGVAYLSGGNLSAQVVVGSKVISEKVLVRSLFNKRLGTICLLSSVCPKF